MNIGNRVILTHKGMLQIIKTAHELGKLTRLGAVFPVIAVGEEGVLTKYDFGSALWECRFEKCHILVNEDMVEVLG